MRLLKHLGKTREGETRTPGLGKWFTEESQGQARGWEPRAAACVGEVATRRPREAAFEPATALDGFVLLLGNWAGRGSRARAGANGPRTGPIRVAPRNGREGDARRPGQLRGWFFPSHRVAKGAGKADDCHASVPAWALRPSSGFAPSVLSWV